MGKHAKRFVIGAADYCNAISLSGFSVSARATASRILCWAFLDLLSRPAWYTTSRQKDVENIYYVRARDAPGHARSTLSCAKCDVSVVCTTSFDIFHSKSPDIRIFSKYGTRERWWTAFGARLCGGFFLAGKKCFSWYGFELLMTAVLKILFGRECLNYIGKQLLNHDTVYFGYALNQFWGRISVIYLCLQ